MGDAKRTGWQAQFHSALISYLVAHGTLVAQGPTEYSWKAYGKLGPGQGWGWDPAVRHVEEDCAISFERSTFEDSEWTEWAGTFYPDTHHEGIEAIVTCCCGQVQGRRWRFTEGHAALLRGIT